ncbi:hypothetical protein [Mammaliicoccus lentus]|uniref:hypothetical protein n=1 Tax=Mammaliicoccus lentus TaxID=42858 RepID=UPI0010728303|nr:hypothetical protein [Mammaliicoccus lentus]MBF0793335.1 hypothetical protein [Mammaliicoccus lentus]TFV17837.1 hypothetical protein E4T78_01630 [Mammaliicoccus lentus]
MKATMNIEKELLRLKEKIKYSCEQISKYDLQRNELYHDIETRKANAFEGYQLFKELQQVLQMRRAWKNRHKELYSEYQSLGGDKKLKSIQRRKKQKVDRIIKKDNWYTAFNDEAMAILNGEVI